ncbi:cobyric acid synthase [Virgibacillus sp. SK37]|uniref:cobyric acid synthase n=1 Tax=Virgibacillus sp. SK37 TaxID=403957 RepID=UPI0004D1F695|nr:cobyric acid synthase [Virgibacillus sp. SK37]AIF42860.1 cobyric acid synthase [Virgibacillus sp. SK37]
MKGIMIQGTASNVGKSLLATALCRLYVNKGYAVAPFKAQNMSSFTILLGEDVEMSIAQFQQAQAARIEPSVYMNPIVLKPHPQQETEVLLLGKAQGKLQGSTYKSVYYDRAKQVIQTGLSELEKKYDLLVIEGAGSPVEMNLKGRDLANMAIAELADVPVILVADIDRGGAFASIVGTLELLAPEERKRVKGLIINKFHGYITSFSSGKEWIEQYTGIPVLGVIPGLKHHIKEEDELDANDGRELGLPTDEDYDQLATHVEKYIDWKRLLAISLGETHAS